MRVAVVQMTSTDDLAGNLKAAREGVAEAAAQGAQWIALPENFAYLRREGLPFPCAQDLSGEPAQWSGEIVDCLRELAARHRVWLLGGTLPERIADDQRVHNTSLLLDPEGRVAARYRKLHLFDVDLGSAGGGRFCESEIIAPGEEVVVADAPFGPVGLSICYDVRFPELYRRMADRGARWITVPSAFAPHTGKDHWEVLLRARAIESQCFVLAPAQCGRHSEDRASYGRSMIVDPWGLVLAQGADRPCVAVADCDLADQDRIRAAVPSLQHRRLGPA